MAQANNSVPDQKIREQVRPKILGIGEIKSTVEERPKESSYSVIAHLGSTLPENYKNLIFSKWMRSLKYGNDYFKLAEAESYFKHYQKYIEFILNSPGAVVRLAVLTEEPDVVFGFSVSRGHILDYVHVHKDVRKKGIATSLLNFEFNFITHLTGIGMTIWGSKYPKVQFDPFA